MKSAARGFTLIELLVVITIIVIASAVTSLAIRDSSSTRLEREGARLSALLESARAEARASALAVRWELRTSTPDKPQDFRFVGLPPSERLPQRWLVPGIGAEIVGARAVVLGPEPLIGAQRIVLSLEGRRLVLATDGLSPFSVVDEQ